MSETQLSIPIEHKKLSIYGTLRGELTSPLIIICHGYGGWMHEMLLYNGARYFEKAGYSTLRLSMYGGGEGSRNISGSDVMTHASDIDDVVSYVKSQGAQWVGVAGHSYSGLATVYSTRQEFQAAALWDPTHTDGYDDPESVKNLKNDFILIDELDSYVSGTGSGYVYAKTVFDNDYPKSREMAAKFKIPTCIINASWSEKQQAYGKDYADNINAPTLQIVIPDSTHPFTSDGAAEKLFAATDAFFKQYR